MNRWLRGPLADPAGGVAWLAGVFLFFGPAQRVLADPEYQSAKFLAVFAEVEPLPRVAGSLWVLIAGILVIGVVYGVVFDWLSPALPGRGWRKGVSFGLVAWALMVPGSSSISLRT